MPGKKLWAYISRLEKVIKETMESSEEIAELVGKIEQEGVSVSLNCIALFSDPEGRSFTGPKGKAVSRPRRGKKAGKGPKPEGEKKTPSRKRVPKFEITDSDHEFLRSIGIKFE